MSDTPPETPASTAPGAGPDLHDALKLTTYFGERDRTGAQLLADALLELYGRHRLQTSILLRGVLGFGRHHQLHTDRLLSLSEDLPTVSVAVDRRDRIEALLADVLALGGRGLVTLERARLVLDLKTPETVPALPGEATKLTLYLGRRERVEGQPAFAAVCQTLYEHGVAGATALLGVDGTRHGRRQRAAFFSANAEVPVMLVAVGDSGPIASALGALAGRLESPLVTLERISVCKRDGQLLAAPDALPGQDSSGLPLWQKLMVYSSAAAGHEGRPLHAEILRRLRAGDAAGATVLRGLWGFHGVHAPHGDRLLSIRRHVPAITIIVDRPERIARSFAIVDELTREHGLVTSEMVPAAAAIADVPAGAGLRLARDRC